jgi:hypothetical protein
MLPRDEDARSFHCWRGYFGTRVRQFAPQGWIVFAAFAPLLPCMAQPPGIVYSTTIPYSNPSPYLLPSVNVVATDASGNSYVAGSAFLNGLAGTPGVLEPQFPGGTCQELSGTATCSAAFIAKFDSNGALVFLTYLGGAGSDDGLTALVVDAAGDIYVGGTTTLTNFPLAGAPWRPTVSMGYNAFVAELSGDGTTLLWSTVLTGATVQLALAPDTSLYVLDDGDATSTLTRLTSAGQFVTSVNVPLLSNALAIGTDGSVYLSGSTAGTSPTSVPDVAATPGAWQAT